MSAKYKLYYFNARGRAELTRLVFAEAGVEYIDLRFNVQEWTAKYKQMSPSGGCPFLEVDGKLLGQSWAIARYAARDTGLYGKDTWQSALIDQTIYTIDDMMQHLISWKQEKDEAKKVEKAKVLEDTTLPQFLKRMENLLKQNNGGKEFFVGEKITLADLAVFNAVSNITTRFPKATLSDVPALAEFIVRIRARPKIAEWLQKRPVTEN